MQCTHFKHVLGEWRCHDAVIEHIGQYCWLDSTLASFVLIFYLIFFLFLFSFSCIEPESSIAFRWTPHTKWQCATSIREIAPSRQSQTPQHRPAVQVPLCTYPSTGLCMRWQHKPSHAACLHCTNVSQPATNSSAPKRPHTAPLSSEWLPLQSNNPLSRHCRATWTSHPTGVNKPPRAPGQVQLGLGATRRQAHPVPAPGFGLQPRIPAARHQRENDCPRWAAQAWFWCVCACQNQGTTEMCPAGQEAGPCISPAVRR